MTPLFLAVALVAEIAVDSVVTATPQLSPRPIRRAVTRIMPGGTIVSTEGDAVATTKLQLERAKPPYLDANAEYMSVGPLGAAVPDTSSGPGYFSMGPAFRRLRVTLSGSERSTWLTIDDILTGRADTRTVKAAYIFHLFGIPDLWAALPRAPRVLGPDPTGPPIRWISPTRLRGSCERIPWLSSSRLIPSFKSPSEPASGEVA